MYSDMIFAFYGNVLSFNSQLYCLDGCLSMIVWTHAVLGVYMHVFGIFVFALVQRN